GAAGTCNVFDGKSYSLLYSLKLPDADNVRFDPGSGLVYVGHEENALTAFDAKTYEVKTTVKLPGPPEAFQLDSERKRLYLNVVRPPSIAVIDLDKHEMIANHGLKLAAGNYPMALDRQNQRVFVGCRKPPMVVAYDAKEGKEIWGVEIPGDIDDVFFDAKRMRLYASCGEGFLTILEQNDGGRGFGVVEKLPTAKLARTCFFDA